MATATYNKVRVSETEINKKRDIGALDDHFDVHFLKKYLSGSTYEDLCREHNISMAQVEIRLSDIMHKLTDKMRITINDRRVYTQCLVYKQLWLTMIRDYQLGQQLYNNNILYINFLAYFKRQDPGRKEFILKQLQDNL